MANIKSAIKRARQNPKRRRHNASRRSMTRTFVKKVLVAIDSGDVEQARLCFVHAQKALDMAASKGLIHKNKASRSKQRLSARIKAMGGGSSTTPDSRAA